MSKKNQKLISVVILAFDGSVPSTITSPMEVFSFAGTAWNHLTKQKETPFFDVTVVTVSGEPAVCHGNLRIAPHKSTSAVRKADLIIIPGAGVTKENILENCRSAIPWIKKQYERGAVIASICTGSFLLAEAGLLEGKVATTHWGYAHAFRKRYPNILLQPEKVITEADRLFCAGGVHCANDLSILLVERFCGRQAALAVSKALLIEPNKVSQQPFAEFDFHKQHEDQSILDVQASLELRFHEALCFERMACDFSMSPRNFKRRFKGATGETPLVYLHKLRISAAKYKIEQGVKNLNGIGEEVGYTDSQFYRKLFKRYVGVTPSHYREMVVVKR